jgi:hypothetical protein
MTLVFPLSLWDVSLVLAVTAIVLLVTSEILSPYYGAANLKINRKRLRNSAITTSIMFLVTVAIRIATMILGLS